MTVKLNNPVLLLDSEKAADDLVSYLSSYTGRFFETLAGRSDPNRFEATDVVAVSCLSVNVPPETAGWLLVGDGADQCADQLIDMQVEPAASLRDHDLASNEAALTLWRLLSGRHQIGPTIASKLLAAKRPHLFPIFDTYVADALLPAEHRQNWQWWAPWRQLLTGPESAHLFDAIGAVRDAVARTSPTLPVSGLSDLRLLDIVIWMNERRRRQT